MKSYSTLLGIIAGLATGALIGILFAPENGTITRRRIFGKEDSYIDKLKIEFDELVETLREKSGCTKKEAEELVATGKTEFVKPKEDL